MSINDILKHQGWELVHRDGWIAVQDHRPEFYDAFRTKRVGKIVNTGLYVTSIRLSDVTQRLVRQLGLEPQGLKSTSGTRDATYWGFDTKDVSEASLKVFVGQLTDAINGLM